MPRVLSSAWVGLPHMCQLLLTQDSSDLDLAHGYRTRTLSRLEHLQEARAPHSHVLNQRKSLLSPGHRDSASITPTGQANLLVMASQSCYALESKARDLAVLLSPLLQLATFSLPAILPSCTARSCHVHGVSLVASPAVY